LDGIELQICQLITDTPIHFPEKNINAYIISPTILNTMQVDHFVKLEGLQITNMQDFRTRFGILILQASIVVLYQCLLDSF